LQQMHDEQSSAAESAQRLLHLVEKMSVEENLHENQHITDIGAT